MLHDVIVFDFFGVVCSEIAPFWLVKYVSDDDAKYIKSTVVHLADTGEISQQEMFEKLSEIVHIPVERIESEWWSYVQIDGEVVKIISNLKTKYPVALLTNSPAQFVREILKRNQLTLLFDPIVVSSEEGIAKPDLAIYRQILNRISVPPEHAIMIDDNPVNVNAAINVGMKGLLFSSSTQLKNALADLNYINLIE